MSTIPTTGRGFGRVGKLERLAKSLNEIIAPERQTFSPEEEITDEQDHALHVRKHLVQRTAAFEKYLRTRKDEDRQALEVVEKHIEGHRSAIPGGVVGFRSYDVEQAEKRKPIRGQHGHFAGSERGTGSGGGAAKPYDLVGAMMEYESGEMNDVDAVRMFSHIVKNGMHHTLQGSYGRTAANLIARSILDDKGNILIKLPGSGAKYEPGSKSGELGGVFGYRPFDEAHAAKHLPGKHDQSQHAGGRTKGSDEPRERYVYVDGKFHSRVSDKPEAVARSMGMKLDKVEPFDHPVTGRSENVLLSSTGGNAKQRAKNQAIFDAKVQRHMDKLAKHPQPSLEAIDALSEAPIHEAIEAFQRKYRLDDKQVSDWFNRHWEASKSEDPFAEKHLQGRHDQAQHAGGHTKGKEENWPLQAEIALQQLVDYHDEQPSILTPQHWKRAQEIVERTKGSKNPSAQALRLLVDRHGDQMLTSEEWEKARSVTKKSNDPIAALTESVMELAEKVKVKAHVRRTKHGLSQVKEYQDTREAADESDVPGQHMRRIAQQNMNMPAAMRGILGAGDLEIHGGKVVSNPNYAKGGSYKPPKAFGPKKTYVDEQGFEHYTSSDDEGVVFGKTPEDRYAAAAGMAKWIRKQSDDAHPDIKGLKQEWTNIEDSHESGEGADDEMVIEWSQGASRAYRKIGAKPAAKHLPGKHDQAEHGRSRGGEPASAMGGGDFTQNPLSGFTHDTETHHEETDFGTTPYRMKRTPKGGGAPEYFHVSLDRSKEPGQQAIYKPISEEEYKRTPKRVRKSDGEDTPPPFDGVGTVASLAQSIQELAEKVKRHVPKGQKVMGRGGKVIHGGQFAPSAEEREKGAEPGSTRLARGEQHAKRQAFARADAEIEGVDASGKTRSTYQGKDDPKTGLMDWLHPREREVYGAYLRSATPKELQHHLRVHNAQSDDAAQHELRGETTPFGNWGTLSRQEADRADMVQAELARRKGGKGGAHKPLFKEGDVEVRYSKSKDDEPLHTVHYKGKLEVNYGGDKDAAIAHAKDLSKKIKTGWYKHSSGAWVKDAPESASKSVFEGSAFDVDLNPRSAIRRVAPEPTPQTVVEKSAPPENSRSRGAAPTRKSVFDGSPFDLRGQQDGGV